MRGLCGDDDRDRPDRKGECPGLSGFPALILTAYLWPAGLDPHLQHGRAESSRVENFPYHAIEEAVVNALYHRGYDVRESVETRTMHDEFVVLS